MKDDSIMRRKRHPADQGYSWPASVFSENTDVRLDIARSMVAALQPSNMLEEVKPRVYKKHRRIYIVIGNTPYQDFLEELGIPITTEELELLKDEWMTR